MKREKKNLFFIATLIFGVFSLFVWILSSKNERFADFFNRTSAAFFRNTLLELSNLVPFSLFEFFCVVSPALFVFFIYFMKTAKGRTVFKRFLSALGIFLLLFSLFVNTLSVSYGASAIFGFSEFSKTDVKYALTFLCERINGFGNFEYPQPQQLSEELFSAFSKINVSGLTISDEAPKIKKIKNEVLASRLGILGIYSFPSSEINVNFSAPEYTACFSAAHEMAHLFGVSREGEASFLGYLASLEAQNDGIRYSAYLSAFEAVFSEACLIDRDFSSEIYAALSLRAKNDLEKYRDFYFMNHGKIAIGADKLNGELLDFAIQGDNADYSFFVKLLVPYLSNRT